MRNLTNGKEVVVQVTDRGPYSRKFVIDLSRAAARELDIIRYGWRPVEILPFVPGKVPFKLEASRERPELDLGFTTDSGDEPPVWQDDSLYLSHHRLSRTRVTHVHPDSLKEAVINDTTLKEAVKKVRSSSGASVQSQQPR